MKGSSIPLSPQHQDFSYIKCLITQKSFNAYTALDKYKGLLTHLNGKVPYGDVRACPFIEASSPAR